MKCQLFKQYCCCADVSVQWLPVSQGVENNRKPHTEIITLNVKCSRKCSKIALKESPVEKLTQSHTSRLQKKNKTNLPFKCLNCYDVSLHSFTFYLLAVSHPEFCPPIPRVAMKFDEAFQTQDANRFCCPHLGSSKSSANQRRP